MLIFHVPHISSPDYLCSACSLGTHQQRHFWVKCKPCCGFFKEPFPELPLWRRDLFPIWILNAKQGPGEVPKVQKACSFVGSIILFDPCKYEIIYCHQQCAMSLRIFKTVQDAAHWSCWSHTGFMATACRHSVSGGTSGPSASVSR